MLTLHHLENSQSIRILWLFEELGIEYAFKMYDRNPETQMAPAEYHKASPLNSAPYITDGDLVMAESNAIIEYILGKYGDGGLTLSPESPDWPRYLFWFHAVPGSLQPLLSGGYLFHALKTRVPFFLKPIMHLVIGQVEKAFQIPRTNAVLSELEKNLTGSEWMAGDQFTVADIAMGYSLDAAQARGLLETYPSINAYIDRLRARSGYQNAVKKDGKYKPF